ncbi:prostaglandin E synthase 3 homolog [Plodia interpunctella]|uniref:prostaglandin E synthase 3 homolog n=1 Tax=Plodia interpunctella TaxID=58824 RepID=UPI00236776EE|nr:uncharacterized protein CG16817-like [Plodia interpunctella]
MTSETIPTPPSVSWAQRNSRILLTINVECEKPHIKIDNKSFAFKGLCQPDNKVHEIKIDLYDEIDPEKSTYLNKGRLIDVCLVKAKIDQPFWLSLTNDKKKHHWLKVDFNRWQDEDDSNDEIDDMNDMFSDKLGDFGNENESEDTSSAEDEDLPDVK